MKKYNYTFKSYNTENWFEDESRKFLGYETIETIETKSNSAKYLAKKWEEINKTAHRVAGNSALVRVYDQGVDVTDAFIDLLCEVLS